MPVRDDQATLYYNQCHLVSSQQQYIGRLENQVSRLQMAGQMVLQASQQQQAAPKFESLNFTLGPGTSLPPEQLQAIQQAPQNLGGVPTQCPSAAPAGNPTSIFADVGNIFATQPAASTQVTVPSSSGVFAGGVNPFSGFVPPKPQAPFASGANTTTTSQTPVGANGFPIIGAAPTGTPFAFGASNAAPKAPTSNIFGTQQQIPAAGNSLFNRMSPKEKPATPPSGLKILGTAAAAAKKSLFG
jgi:hypothetical protein